jgi:hypothetical protein
MAAVCRWKTGESDHAAGASSSMILMDEQHGRQRTIPVCGLWFDLGSASIIDRRHRLDRLGDKPFISSNTICGSHPWRTYWMMNIAGAPEWGKILRMLNCLYGCQTNATKCLCLGEFATMSVVTGIDRFPDDFKNPVNMHEKIV